MLGNKQYSDAIKKPTSSLFVQFHAEQTSMMKEEILREITKHCSRIRVIFATSALGMGVNAPFIDQVIHLSPPSTLEAYMQEFGRAGRSGKPSKAILYYARSEVSDWKVTKKLVDASMVQYCEAEQCLRKLILEHFGFDFEKQDNCCSNCVPQIIHEESHSITSIKYRNITEESRDLLALDFNEVLANYDMKTEDEVLFEMFLGKDMSSELSRKLMLIIDSVEYIRDKETLKTFEIFEENIVVEIMTLIEKHTNVP